MVFLRQISNFVSLLSKKVHDGVANRDGSDGIYPRHHC